MYVCIFVKVLDLRVCAVPAGLREKVMLGLELCHAKNLFKKHTQCNISSNLLTKKTVLIPEDSA